LWKGHIRTILLVSSTALIITTIKFLSVRIETSANFYLAGLRLIMLRC